MRSERGIALLVTLLTVTLLSIVVIEFTHSTEVNAHVTRNSVSAMQARYLARSGLAFAEMALKLDAKRKQTTEGGAVPVETLADSWAVPFPPTPFGDGVGTVAFVITDESGRFNVNALAFRGNPALLELRKQLFQGMLTAIGADENLVFALVDWLDADDQTDRESGAEDQFYLGLETPRRARNGPILAVEEIRLVRGYDELTREQWQRLRSMLTVLPNVDLRINVNTATESLVTGVFTAFGEPGLAELLLASRLERPILSVAELQALAGAARLPPLLAQSTLDVRSRFFTLHGIGEAGEARRAVAELVERTPSTDRIRVLEWRPDTAAPAFALTSTASSDGIDSPP